MEVMLALFILTVSIMMLSQLQTRSMLRVWHSREETDRLYLIKKYLYRMYLDPFHARKVTQKFETPSLQLVVEPVEIHKKSALFPYAKELQYVRATGRWSRGTTDRQLVCVAVIPRGKVEEGTQQ